MHITNSYSEDMALVAAKADVLHFAQRQNGTCVVATKCYNIMKLTTNLIISNKWE